MADHELVIRNGIVVDGTGLPRRRADVAIDGGKIAEVGFVEGTGSRELTTRQIRTSGAAMSEAKSDTQK